MGYRMVSGGRADKASKAVKKTATLGAAGAATGALASTGALIDPGMGTEGMAQVASNLPSMGTGALTGAAIAIGVPMAYRAGRALLGRRKSLDEGFGGARS
jgi:hypothetical protein